MALKGMELALCRLCAYRDESRAGTGVFRYACPPCASKEEMNMMMSSRVDADQTPCMAMSEPPVQPPDPEPHSPPEQPPQPQEPPIEEPPMEEPPLQDPPPSQPPPEVPPEQTPHYQS
ncbi:hypothetical protein C8D96_0103 [Kushneria marisflavi]|nr:hypothetical protein C8D96_0103 [Kushneria marisflavi]